MSGMARNEVTIDLGALRRNVKHLVELASGSELWAVVKANAYGHGAADCGDTALGAGASALCVATVSEGLALRRELPEPRIIVLGPSSNREVAQSRDARLELVVSSDIPSDIPVHLKLDTGMGRWGMSELVRPDLDVVGLMTHFATADDDLDFARIQLGRFLEATADYTHLTRHAANSAALLRIPEARLDAVRCGIAIYGLSPFQTDAADDGLEPVLSWHSEVSLVKQLQPGESTGYGRRFIAAEPTWIGIVPVGYADGFRRGLTGTTVLVDGEPARVVGTVSMDAFAVELDGPTAVGTRVTLVGSGVPLEAHARHAGTINYELATQIETGSERARRTLYYS